MSPAQAQEQAAPGTNAEQRLSEVLGRTIIQNIALATQNESCKIALGNAQKELDELKKENSQGKMR
jgi:hypothetical protein